MCERLIALMPRHSVYVEGCLGNGAVLRRKLPALRSIGIDLDARVVDRWRAYKFPGLELVRGDVIAWLRDAGQQLPPDALVYLDPPYPASTVRTRRIYRCGFTDDQHRELLDVAQSLPCSVFISSYWSRLYAARLAGWDHTSFPAMTRGGVRREHLWWRASHASFGVSARSVGDGWRDRQRIRRKVSRWTAKFARTRPGEREAILSALLEAHEAGRAARGPGSRTRRRG